VIPRTTPQVDSRDSNAILDQFQDRRQAYAPKWNPPDKTAGAAIGQVFSRFATAILQRLNQAPAKDKLAFLDLLGLRLISAQSARAPIVFQLGQGAPDGSAPEGTQVAAPPPPGSSQQVVFSTEADAGIAAAKLTEVVSLWPGRDQYIDHSAALQAGQPFTLFQHLQLQQTDHILYLAHSTLLAFAGTTHLLVTFDLAQGSSLPLDIAWEYWDGQVWRGFKDYKPSCLEAAEAGRDGTDGLSTNGSIHLCADGAQTAPTTVNGVQSYWIRGRLTQPLLPDPNELLPEVEMIRLLTHIDRELEWGFQTQIQQGGISSTQSISFMLYDDQNTPLDGISVTLMFPQNPGLPSPAPQTTSGGGGVFSLSPGIPPATAFQLCFTYLEVAATFNGQLPDPADNLSISLRLKGPLGLLPDKAVSDGRTLDVTKAFYPFGQVPLLGSAFYFKQQEVFTKPGANVQLYVGASFPGPPTGATGTVTPLTPKVTWEYWDGAQWSPLSLSATSGDFIQTEVIRFTVPVDMTSTKVANEDGLWIRVRLVDGAYGYSQTISFLTATPASSVEFNVTQAPAVTVFQLGYSWQPGPFPLEQVFTYNDFQFEDHTDDARWPGNPFTPYQPLNDVTPALYLGFDKQLPVNNFGLYMDIVEQAGQAAGPALVWEYWNGGGWEGVAVEDETQQLQLPGMLTFIPAADSQPLARFDQSLYWLRGRLKEDGPPNETTINDIYPNAVWASQWQTFTNAPLGASTGVPNQVFQFNQIPVLVGQTIEVQELSGPRANTEWRTLAMEVASGDSGVVTKLEAILASEGAGTDIVLGSLHLTRDKTKRVTAVFVQWQEQPNFFNSGSDDRHYVLDHASGRLFFGSGDAGKIPPSGAAIQASTFRSGGGLSGNVAAQTITQLLGSVSGVQGITNPRAAEGGADGETLEAFALRAPLSIRNRGRAIVPQDYETMAREASAGVAVARAIPTRNPSGITVPGWVTLIIIPQSQEPQPLPSFGLREEVRTYLEQHAPGDTAAAHQIEVIGPTYLPIDVTATLAPKDPAQTGTVEQDALSALAEFLHPLYGGPDGLGWDLGRSVYVSDIAGVLGNVDGVDYIEELSLSVNGVLQGDNVPVPPDQIVVAGQLKLTLILPSSR